MTGWFDYAIFIGPTTAAPIIVKKLKCKWSTPPTSQGSAWWLRR